MVYIIYVTLLLYKRKALKLKQWTSNITASEMENQQRETDILLDIAEAIPKDWSKGVRTHPSIAIYYEHFVKNIRNSQYMCIITEYFIVSEIFFKYYLKYPNIFGNTFLIKNIKKMNQFSKKIK